MSIKDQTSRGSGQEAALPDVQQEQIDFQVLQRLARIENALTSMDSRVGERLDTIEGHLAGKRGSTVRKVIEKPNIRNMLMGLVQKGWLSEAEAIDKTGWQTIGVRFFVTKLRSLGLSVETEERDGMPHYRIAK